MIKNKILHKDTSKLTVELILFGNN